MDPDELQKPIREFRRQLDHLAELPEKIKVKTKSKSKEPFPFDEQPYKALIDVETRKLRKAVLGQPLNAILPHIKLSTEISVIASGKPRSAWVLNDNGRSIIKGMLGDVATVHLRGLHFHFKPEKDEKPICMDQAYVTRKGNVEQYEGHLAIDVIPLDPLKIDKSKPNSRDLLMRERRFEEFQCLALLIREMFTLSASEIPGEFEHLLSLLELPFEEMHPVRGFIYFHPCTWSWSERHSFTLAAKMLLSTSDRYKRKGWPGSEVEEERLKTWREDYETYLENETAFKERMDYLQQEMLNGLKKGLPLLEVSKLLPFCEVQGLCSYISSVLGHTTVISAEDLIKKLFCVFPDFWTTFCKYALSNRQTKNQVYKGLSRQVVNNTIPAPPDGHDQV